MDKPNCYTCKWRANLPGDAHSQCVHPETGGPRDQFDALVSLLSGSQVGPLEKLGIKLDAHGFRNGWAYWPANFDPVWLLACNGHTPKDVPVPAAESQPGGSGGHGAA